MQVQPQLPNALVNLAHTQFELFQLCLNFGLEIDDLLLGGGHVRIQLRAQLPDAVRDRFQPESASGDFFLE